MSNDLYVTRPALPDFDAYQRQLKGLWQSATLTNNGALHQQLESELAEFLGVPYISLFDNGTNALIAGLAALDIQGEVITTPYSFVATSHALLWNHLTPVFVDVDPTSGNLDAAQVEAAITGNTSAILAVHCYGIPCDTRALQTIAHRHQLKLFYDAAHAFAVRDPEGSILRHGDLAALSFHATKVFNTCEGGALISHDPEMKRRIERIRNFGIVSEEEISGTGFNGKMSELHAGFGLALLPDMPRLLAQRADIFSRYAENLSELAGLELMSPAADITWNHAYAPLRVDEACPVSRDALYDALRQQGIHARKYFHPLISSVPAYAGCAGANALPHAQQLARQVLCLPIFPAMTNDEQKRVCDAIRAALI